MKRIHTLRDARHLEKYIFTLTNPLFYEPFEDRYQPNDHYITVVRKLLADLGKEWQLTRDGLWYHTYPATYEWPSQGWKIHVSATLANSVSTLTKAARICLIHDIPFKFALDKNILGLFGSKRWARGSSGKFITIYPNSVQLFVSLLDDLYEQLHEAVGPYILSDRRYRDCRVLYYRYGSITRRTQLDITGAQQHVIVAPDGTLVPDERSPHFTPPKWATDPFSNSTSQWPALTLNKERYIIRSALSFSNSGGVYLADDQKSGVQIVIKEARAHTVEDGMGSDAISRIKKEFELLQLLEPAGITPRPIELFREWDNVFLAEEYIDGIDLRKILLTSSPLTRVRPSLTDTTEYCRIYRTLCANLASLVDVLHCHGIMLGDLSPNNMKIDPETYAIRLIDLEFAARPGIDALTFLHTPGFKTDRNVRKNTQGFEDDLYAVAAIMLYTLFPIAALSALRQDLFDTVLPIMLSDAGWEQTNTLNVIRGLSNNEITCRSARKLLDAPACIASPHVSEDVDPDYCLNTVRELGHFICSHMRLGRDESLFATDPFMYQTNPLSLGFGLCGILYALKKCCVEIPQEAHDRLERELDSVKTKGLPPGLLTGTAGIAWVLAELGQQDRAIQFIRFANESTLVRNHHSYFYGMAGIGMANLYFYNRTALPYYLQMARSLADWLLESADESEAGICWRVNDTIHIGYGYGQSGVALFLLRLSQLSGEEHYRSKGRRALDYDLSNGVEMEQGVLSFPDVPSGATLLPYVEEGSAGIAKVAMRFGNCTLLDSILLDAHRKYAGFAGLLFGLSSFVDAFTDAFLFSQDKKYLTMAKRPISGLRDIYLFKQTQGVAASGDGLFRVTCDYGTGVAGVMRALYRYTHLDHADFVLDEFVSENGPAPAHDDDSFCGEAVAVPLVTGRRLEHNL